MESGMDLMKLYSTSQVAWGDPFAASAVKYHSHVHRNQVEEEIQPIGLYHNQSSSIFVCKGLLKPPKFLIATSKKEAVFVALL
jgi:hypothetical protein